MEWSYGVTTVVSRKDDLLPRTLQSLANAGFDKPRLFVDDCKDTSDYLSFGLEVTSHYPKIRTVGNWVLSLWELYVREPNADRYAIFQDDIVTCLNLKAFLEHCEYPLGGYLNLITYPKNEKILKGKEGWQLSDQRGKGAQALVFDRNAVVSLLGAKHFIIKPQDRRKGWKCIDGCISDSMRELAMKEYVHIPSLVYHTGEKSSMEGRKQPKSETFRGEDFDAMQLILNTVE